MSAVGNSSLLTCNFHVADAMPEASVWHSVAFIIISVKSVCIEPFGQFL